MTAASAAAVAQAWPNQVGQSAAGVAALTSRLEAALEVAQVICAALEAGGTVMTCGNGGSALEAQHFAAELVAHFKRDRRSLAALALPSDYGVLTAIANDLGYDNVYARQVEGLARRGDVVIGFSTSGGSENVARALAQAQDCGAIAVAMTGEGGGRVAEAANYHLDSPATETARVQECHLVLTHIICDYVDAYFAD